MHDLPEKELLQTLEELRKVATDFKTGTLSTATKGRPSALHAIANEAGVDPLFLDMWAEEKTTPAVEGVVLQTLSRAEKILADKRKPDDRDQILAGEEFGVVFMPPELVRQLWGLGEAVVHFQDGEAESARVQPRAIQVMELAAQWVRDARDRWGTPDRVEKVNVAPLLKVQQEAPF